MGGKNKNKGGGGGAGVNQYEWLDSNAADAQDAELQAVLAATAPKNVVDENARQASGFVGIKNQ
jgi:hypothetical protein